MRKVLLIDSGSGGVNILKECIKNCPFFDYLLFCDDKNIPYGNKSKEELFKITEKNLQDIFDFFKFEIVIFACNTLTAVCLAECKNKFEKINFFGVEPMIGEALGKFCKEEILVLATSNTKKYCDSLQSWDGKVLCIDNLASEIDENIDCIDKVFPLVEKAVGRFKGKIKAVVLGCTHYVAVKELIQQVLGEITFFDGGKVVAEKLKKHIEKTQPNDLVVNSNSVLLQNFQVQIVTSGSQEKRNKFLWWVNQ